MFGLSIYGLMSLMIPQIFFSFCLFKEITHLPCPACGTGRGLQSVMKGNFLEGLIINPLLIFYLITPIVIYVTLKDLMMYKSVTLSLLEKVDYVIKKNFWLKTTLILMFLINWVWNFYKQN